MVYIFSYSLEVIVHVAVVLLYNFGQTHADSPVIVSFFFISLLHKVVKRAIALQIENHSIDEGHANSINKL